MAETEVDPQLKARKRVMDTLALASETELTKAWDALSAKPSIRPVRGPETGLVMVRAKTGGSGAAFNLGEVAVSRATVMLENGTAGHAHVLGSELEKARLAAVFDALWQTETHKTVVEQLMKEIARRVAKVRHKQEQETAATRVDFFTMVRGED